MSGAPDYLALAIRFLVAAGLVVMAAFVIARGMGLGLGTGRRKAHALRRKALPCREGEARLEELVRAASRRPHARDLVQVRLRALSRDVAALRLGIDDTRARSLVERGDFPPGEGHADFLLHDWLGAPAGPDRRFTEGAEALLSALEEWTEYLEEEKIDG